MFVGGSTLDAALAVLELPAALDVLDSLVSKSLLRQIETSAAPRLAMLETIREFGLELLTQTAELEAARRAHAMHYLSFAEEAERHLTGAEQKVWLQQLEAEQGQPPHGGRAPALDLRQARRQIARRRHPRGERAGVDELGDLPQELGNPR